MKKLLTTLAAVGVLSIVSIATANAGTPVGPGGCNMLTPIFTPSPVGLDPMMTGSGSGNGVTSGAIQMQQMLLLFSSQQFCGL
jgi:hypothetical protein